MLAVFYPAVFGGRVFFERDIAVLWHPQVEAFVRAVASGAWPVWDPSPAFGQPLLGDPSAQILYPPTWLNLILPAWLYYTVFVVAHTALAALGLYALARRWGLSAGASFTSAALWTLSGPFLSLANLWHHFAGAAWIPIVFLAAESALEARRPKQLLLWALALAGQILAGSADMCAMTAVTLVAYLGWHRMDWHQLGGSTNRRLLATTAAAFLLAACFTAPLWGTAFDLLVRSARHQLSQPVRTYWSVHPLGLLELLFPGLWRGVPLSPCLSALLFDSREPLLASLYLGLPSLALVGAAVGASRHRLRAFLLTSAVVAALIALGRHAPFFGWASAALPPLRILRYPVKAVPLLAFFWALLAGLGVDVFRGSREATRRRWAVAVLGPVLLVGLLDAAGAAVTLYKPEAWASLLAGEVLKNADPGVLARSAQRFLVGASLATCTLIAAWMGRREHGRSVIAVCFLAVGDLLAFHGKLNPLAPRALYAVRPEVLEIFRGAPSPRIYVYDYHQTDKARRYLSREHGYSLRLLPKDWSPAAGFALAMQMYLVPATVGRWGLSGAFEIDYRGLYPAALHRLTVLLRQVEGGPAHLRLLQVGGVTHVLALHQEGFGDLTPLTTFEGLLAEPIRVFGVPGTLPRTYAVGGASVASDDEPGVLIDPAFDPRREVILDSGEPTPPDPAFVGSSQVVEEKPDRVRLQADLSGPGYVVLLDSYDPGWRARVDGRETQMLRANLAFRAVRVPAGHHVVEYAYRPRALVLGLLISGIAILTGAGAVIGFWRYDGR